MAFRQQQYVDYSDGVPDKVKQFVVYFYRHIRYACADADWLKDTSNALLFVPGNRNSLVLL